MAKKTTATEPVIEQPKLSKRDTPEIGTLIEDVEISGHISSLLTTGGEIKTQIGRRADYKKGVEGIGLLGELDNITAELMQLQVRYKIPVLRYGDVAFVSRMQDGRESLDKNKLRQELVVEFAAKCKKGVDVIALVNVCFERATKQGDPFAVREITILGDD